MPNDFTAKDARALGIDYKYVEPILDAYSITDVMCHVKQASRRGKYGILIRGLKDVETVMRELIARGFHYHLREDGVLHVRW